jgi:magnesium-transporting ATPase (P-type)
MPAPDVKTEPPFWQLSVTALMERLNSSPDGLSRAEAAARLIHFGPNLIHTERKRALLLQFLAKFRNPLVIILLTASALSAFTGDAISFFILFVLLINAFFHRPWLESFLFAVALAVGLTPELLPMVVSVTLSRGAQRMAVNKVIVKRLASIHNLGSMDVFCTDKTGTLTEARIHSGRRRHQKWR